MAKDLNDYSVTNEKRKFAARSFFHWYPYSSNARNAKEVFQVWLLSNIRKKFKPPIAGEQFAIGSFFFFDFEAKTNLIALLTIWSSLI